VSVPDGRLLGMAAAAPNLDNVIGELVADPVATTDVRARSGGRRALRLVGGSDDLYRAKTRYTGGGLVFSWCRGGPVRPARAGVLRWDSRLSCESPVL
jgi:hypothetical protein